MPPRPISASSNHGPMRSGAALVAATDAWPSPVAWPASSPRIAGASSQAPWLSAEARSQASSAAATSGSWCRRRSTASARSSEPASSKPWNVSLSRWNCSEFIVVADAADSGRGRRKLGGEKRLGRRPLAPDGGGRDRERLRDFVERQTDEEAQLDHRDQSRIERLQLVERRVDRQDTVRVVALGPRRGMA